MVYAIAKLTIVPLIKLFIKEINGIENIIKKEAFIVAANHSSYFDDLAVPSVIIPVVNKNMHFYVNFYYFNNYFFRKFLEWGQSIPVDVAKGKGHKKTNRKSFEMALKYLKKNGIVGIFPEGGRSINGKLQKAKTGIAKLALTAKVPVLPVGIIGSDKILPKGKFLPRLRRCKINFGKPLYFNKYYSKSDKKSLEKVTRTIMKEIAKLIGQKYDYN